MYGLVVLGVTLLLMNFYPAMTLSVFKVREDHDLGELFSIGNRNGKERYEMDKDCPKYLKVHAHSGIVSLTSPLDFETRQVIDFHVLASRMDFVGGKERMHIRISVLDVNDEKPVFLNKPCPFVCTVAANARQGLNLFQLVAKDADRTSSIEYIMQSGSSRFSIEPRTGILRSRGHGRYPEGHEYLIGVLAVDTAGGQTSEVVAIKVVVGQLDPQFYEIFYEAHVPESSPLGYKVVNIKAKSHQNLPLTYELFDISGKESSEFRIDKENGDVTLLKTMDYESLRKEFNLLARANEYSRLSSTVNLRILIVDDNDNTPIFQLSQYIAEPVLESVPIGRLIIKVSADDADSSTNGRITYSIDDHNFSVQTINGEAYISTAKRLDYDNTQSHIYNFTLTASDAGTPQRSSSAEVRVKVKNVNDEPPRFTADSLDAQVSEDAPMNTIVYIVQAFDDDGDKVTYSFEGGRQTDRAFHIDSESGIVQLVGELDRTLASYRLNVVARDDSGCCPRYGGKRLSSKAVVNVEVKDINNNAPRITECDSYRPIVYENQSPGTDVVQVIAEDSDTGDNGNVTYSIVKTGNADKLFRVNRWTGSVTTNEVFDRESYRGFTAYGVTIKAMDSGEPSLAGFCTFKVKIGDINDNEPIFDFPSYSTSIKESNQIGSNVIQVYATDKDTGRNANIHYRLIKDPSKFFAINKRTGWISVKAVMGGMKQVELLVQASDSGKMPLTTTVKVTLKITRSRSSYPVWLKDYSTKSVFVDENVQINHVVARLQARTQSNQAVHYKLIEDTEDMGLPSPQGGATVGRRFHSRMQDDQFVVMTYTSLDYETNKEHILTINAANRATEPLNNSTRIKIKLRDKNDEIPEFVGLDKNGRYLGSVAENLEIGSQVMSVTAQDRDATKEFNSVTYYIKQPRDVEEKKFKIDKNTGIITTNTRFDREQQKVYYITVQARDGKPSDRHNHLPVGTPNQGEAEVQIRITDTNDNAPYFRQKVYSATVDETVDKGTAIIVVTAEDVDQVNRLSYSIISGNHGNVFEVIPSTGQIKVRGQLDYEIPARRRYTLGYRVFDDKYSNETTVDIKINDCNDNAPVFTKTKYIYKQLQEEDDNVPKYLLTVKAEDADNARRTYIRYSLSGEYAGDGTFIVDAGTGDISVTRPLNRDKPKGRKIWKFNVLAQDEITENAQSLTGYAEVEIWLNDINDNAPTFDPNHLEGHVLEHSARGVKALTVIATDVDNGNNGSVYYTLRQSPKELFKINSRTGLISTTKNNAMDREKVESYKLIVVAKDRGTPNQLSTSATVKIIVDDINDNKVRFQKKLYNVQISENLPINGIVASFRAIDKDKNSQLTYTLREKDRKHFQVHLVNITKTAVLKIYKKIDFDTMKPAEFNVTVRVSDSIHMDTAVIRVKVTDYNDNEPIVRPKTLKKRISENSEKGKVITRYSGTDKDSGINREFTFSLDKMSQKYFEIGEHSGILKVKGNLDREKQLEHKVIVLAKDKGTPSLTGRAVAVISLSDVNDNYPTLKKDYRPIVFENEKPFQSVARICAKDADTIRNGPPFHFRDPCSHCPCLDNPFCNLFSIKFHKNTGECGGQGVAEITTLASFDREQFKEYNLPILISDSGRPKMRGISHLKIIIGDRNDNKHYKGHQDIVIYNYKGEYKELQLGKVYAKDLDDWDVSNKTFILEKGKTLSTQFKINKNSGELSLIGRAKSGSYDLNVKVYDRVWSRYVMSTVNIRIIDIPEEAIQNFASIRFHGTTPEQFIKTFHGESKYKLFRKFLSIKLKTKLENIDIFTVRQHGENSIDVFYAAHGSPYYKQYKLNGLNILNQVQLEDLLMLRVGMSPVSECFRDKVCDDHVEGDGGCIDDVIMDLRNALKVVTNGTSLIGVNMRIQKKCSCKHLHPNAAMNSIECNRNSCFNGGTCIQHDFSYECICLLGFNGGRCQQTHLGFLGDGWAWFNPFTSCGNAHIGLEFLTDREDSVLFYSGPMHSIDQKDPTDFIFLELYRGLPKLRINLGSGEIHMVLDGRNKNGVQILDSLADNRWHRIDIYVADQIVKLVVDNCDYKGIYNYKRKGQNDLDICEISKTTPGDSRYLNLNSVLQLGGFKYTGASYPSNLTRTSFIGCMRNLVYNSELYDLHTSIGGKHRNVRNTCLEEKCHCPRNAVCLGGIRSRDVCKCKPGFHGQNCNKEFQAIDLRYNSFVEWDFTDSYHRSLQSRGHIQTLQLSLRTRQSHGLIWSAQDPQKYEYIKLEVKGQRLTFLCNAGELEVEVQLSSVNISDGLWHRVTLNRKSRWASLAVDYGEGRFYNESYIAANDLEIDLSQRSIFLGGDVKFASLKPIIDNDLIDSCVKDVRFNGMTMPLSVKEMSSVAVLIQRQHVIDSCHSKACLAVSCQRPLVCVDLWRYAQCSCPKGEKHVSTLEVCQPINECLEINSYYNQGPCENDGHCIDRPDGFNCVCRPGYAGHVCSVKAPHPGVTIVATSTVVIISLNSLLLLLLILIILIYKRNVSSKKTLPYTSEDDIRENMINYSDEGAAEEDAPFDINKIKKPIIKVANIDEHITAMARRDHPQLPPHDSVRHYAYEGGDTPTGSLSSLSSLGEDDDRSYDEVLKSFGRPFNRLARHVYGAKK